MKLVLALNFFNPHYFYLQLTNTEYNVELILKPQDMVALKLESDSTRFRWQKSYRLVNL